MAFELTGKIKDFNVDYITNKANLTLAINEKTELINCYDNLHLCEKLSIVIDKHREKRSLNMNNYLWLLLTKIAEERSKDGIKVTKEDVYRDEIRQLNVFYDDEIEPDKVKWRCAAWHQIGTGWLTERVDFSADGNREVIRFYYGSSSYNTTQMHRLIKNVVQDCEALGISTKTPDEIANMLSLWEQEKR